MCLALIPSHFVLVFFLKKDVHYLHHLWSGSYTRAKMHRYGNLIFGTNLDPRPHDHWKGRQTVITKKEVNRNNLILCGTPEKVKEKFEVIVEDKDDSISLDEIWHFLSLFILLRSILHQHIFCGRQCNTIFVANI